MGDEYFYGATLSDRNPIVKWDPETIKNDEYPRSNKLILKQILLGHDAKENEFNVIQVETMSVKDTIKIPIAVLKVGESRHVRLDMEFLDCPVTFTLTEGKGPVYIHGQHLLGTFVEEFEDIEEMEEDILDEEEGVDVHDDEEEDWGEGNPKKKAKLSNNSKGPKQAAPAIAPSTKGLKKK